jgi:cephalosporin-C deacetylase-like acetyl esterase
MGQRRSVTWVAVIGLALAILLTAPALASSPPLLDLWTPAVLQRIRDRATLNPHIIPRLGYVEVFFDSEIDEAKWADSEPPYEIHTGDTIRIHGYLATPAVGGPYPGIVIGHGHHGRGSAEVALAVAAFGYVALSIDGPSADQSTGGPQDAEQAWISVEEVMNAPSPAVSYLYHYAYAGMRALTLLDSLSRVPLNPFRIDRTNFGVIGASMGGQFTYYLNGVDDRVKGAVAIAVAGDWQNLLLYDGAWLYHGLYYYTRDGLRSRQDALNTIADICTDPTLDTFLDYFDPISYAPRQHGPLLTIIGTHDQYFPLPAINSTYERVASAGTNPRFIKRLLLTANGKHGVIESDDLLPTLRVVIETIHNWFNYSFRSGSTPPPTPTVRMEVVDGTMWFRVTAPPGREIRHVDLYFATQLDTVRQPACDFAVSRLTPQGDEYRAAVPIGTVPPCGPPATPENILYYTSVQDGADYTVSSKMHYQFAEMAFGTDFVPRFEHFARDDFPVPPLPAPCD